MEGLDSLKKNWYKSDNYPNGSGEKHQGSLHKNSAWAIKSQFNNP